MPLNPVARAAIEELRRVFHVTDLTPDEIVELNDLGAAQMAAGKGKYGVALTPPIQVGNVVLHPLTLAGMDFMERFVDDIPRKLRNWFFPWLLAHSRSQGDLERINTPEDLAAAIKAFLRRSTATPEELDAACSLLLAESDAENAESMRQKALEVASFAGIRDPALGETIRVKVTEWLRDDQDKKEADGAPEYGVWKKFAVDLGVMTGVSPDYWYFEDRRATLIAFRRACEITAIKAAAFGADEKKPSPEMISAIAELRRAVVRICAARKERENGKEDS